jgi:hypothetical protein
MCSLSIYCTVGIYRCLSLSRRCVNRCIMVMLRCERLQFSRNCSRKKSLRLDYQDLLIRGILQLNLNCLDPCAQAFLDINIHKQRRRTWQ